MILQGMYEFGTSRQRLWDFLTDSARMAKCMPDVKSFKVDSEDKFTAVVRVGAGFIRSDFKFNAEIAEKEPINHLRFKGAGSGSGSNIDLDMSIELRDAPSGSQLSYSADVKVRGVIAGLGQRMMKDSADKILDGVFTCIKQQVG